MTRIRNSQISLGYYKFTQFIKTYAILQTVVGILFLPGYLSAPPFIVPILFTSITLAVFLSWYLSTPPDQVSTPPPHQSKWIRHFPLFKLYRNYFPITLTKTSARPLDPRQNYIFVYHPESLVSYGAYCNFLTEATNFSLKFPGIRPYVLTITFNFYWTLVRSFCLWLGFCDAAQENVEWLLNSGAPHSSQSNSEVDKDGRGSGIAAVIVVPGQEKRIPDEGRADMERNLLKAFTKAGFTRVALMTGTPLVPCFSYGESHIFPHLDITRRVWIVKKCLQTLRTLFPLLKIAFYALYLPNRRAIDTVVGESISVPRIPNPTQEEINHYNAVYLQALTQLFEQHKYVHGVPSDVHVGLK